MYYYIIIMRIISIILFCLSLINLVLGFPSSNIILDGTANASSATGTDWFGLYSGQSTAPYFSGIVGEITSNLSFESCIRGQDFATCTWQPVEPASESELKHAYTAFYLPSYLYFGADKEATTTTYIYGVDFWFLQQAVEPVCGNSTDDFFGSFSAGRY